MYEAGLVVAIIPISSRYMTYWSKSASAESSHAMLIRFLSAFDSVSPVIFAGAVVSAAAGRIQKFIVDLSLTVPFNLRLLSKEY